MKTHNKTHIGFSIIFLVAMISGYVVLFNFIKKDIDRLMVLEARVSEVRAELEKIKSQARLVESSGEDVEVVRSLFINESRLPEFLDGVESYGIDLGVEVSVSDINEEKIVLPIGFPKVESAEISSKSSKKTISLEGIKVDSATNVAKEVTALAITLDVTGEFNDIVRYVEIIEDLPQAIDIVSFELAELIAGDTSEKDFTGSIIFWVISYEQKEKPVVAIEE